MKTLSELKQGQIIQALDGNGAFFNEPNQSSFFYFIKKNHLFIFEDVITLDEQIFLKLVDIENCKIVFDFFSSQYTDWSNVRFDHVYKVIDEEDKIKGEEYEMS